MAKTLEQKVRTGDIEPEDLPALIEFFRAMDDKKADVVVEILGDLYKEYLELTRPKTSLTELEAAISDDPIKNNAIALEMIKLPGFNRELVNDLYNGLGVEVHLGAEGAYGQGQILKRKLNLQQFYTNPEISKVIREVLMIPPQARVYDPTCGSGRLFWHMPNQAMCHGVEIEGNAYDICHAIYPEAQIVNDDTLQHIHENAFDFVVANPPFTLMWEDRQRRLKFTGYNNKAVSELAVMEISVRSLKDKEGGSIAVVMPANAWENKFLDRREFVNWFKQQMYPIAIISLPTTTHEGTVWPVDLHIFQKRSYTWGGWKEVESFFFPQYEFTFKLLDFTDESISKLVAEFKGKHIPQIENYASTIQFQEPFELEVAEVRELTVADYIVSKSEIKSKDVIMLDAPVGEIDNFDVGPVTLIPNGLHADLKIQALRSFFGTKWSASRKEYVDTFRETLARLDQFLEEKTPYDVLPLVSGLHEKDMEIDHSENFVEMLEKRKEWIDFQNIPFEIWVDEDQDFTWKQLFADEGYEVAEPDIYQKWKDKLGELQVDPQYDTFLPHLDMIDNWLKHLFGFQQKDVIRLAMKAAAIHGGVMGLGKTRSSIAVALLKGGARNLIVCPAKLINTWLEEFVELSLPRPYLVEYNDDLPDMEDHQFVLVSYETLARPKDRPRPKGKKRKKNPRGPSYDFQSPLDFEEQVDEFLEHLDIELSSEERRRENPRGKKALEEGEETKEMKDAKEMAMRLLFADNLAAQFDFAFCDEAHYLANPTTIRTQAVWRLKPKEWLFLTGTPIKNRVRGLLSLLLIGWGEGTTAMPYTKADFLEHFTQYKEMEQVVIDSHGFKKSKTKQVEIPQIANPDDLRTLMAPKWMRRTKYEPDVAEDRKFPKPEITFVSITPSEEERRYGKQWYDEYQRILKEVKEAREQLKAMRSDPDYDRSEMSELEAELRTKSAIVTVMINKLRSVALAPQVDWLGKELEVEKGEAEEKGAPKTHKKAATVLTRLITIPEDYVGGLTPRQERLVSEIKAVVDRGETCYTIVDFPAVNYILEDLLEAEGISVAHIDGTVPQKKRKKIIEDFREKQISVILATTGTFDTGINIPGATSCFIIAPSWNWSDMEQAYSRMIRPASTGERFVFFFYLESSIEVYVKQLMEMKRFNQEYVIDYGPRPPDQPWVGIQDAMSQMFKDMEEGTFVV